MRILKIAFLTGLSAFAFAGTTFAQAVSDPAPDSGEGTDTNPYVINARGSATLFSPDGTSTVWHESPGITIASGTAGLTVTSSGHYDADDTRFFIVNISDAPVPAAPPWAIIAAPILLALITARYIVRHRSGAYA